MAGALERARRLTEVGRHLREQVLASETGQANLRWAAAELGIQLEDGDAELALLADLLQYAAWDAFAIVARRLDAERAGTRQPLEGFPTGGPWR